MARLVSRWGVTFGTLALDGASPKESRGRTMSARLLSRVAPELTAPTRDSAAVLPTSSAGVPFFPSESLPRNSPPPTVLTRMDDPGDRASSDVERTSLTLHPAPLRTDKAAPICLSATWLGSIAHLLMTW